MAISSIVRTRSRILAGALSEEGFGVPILIYSLTSLQNTAWTAEYGADSIVIDVTSENFQTVLNTLGVSTAEKLSVDLTTGFSQEQVPPIVKIARQVTFVAKVYTITVNTFNDGTYSLDIGGTAASVALSSAADANAAAAALRAAADTAYTSLGYTVSAVSTNTFTITAAVTGLDFAVTGAGPAANSVVPTIATANTGPVERYQQIEAVEPDHYAIYDDLTNVELQIALGRYVSPITKKVIYKPTYANSNAESSTTTTDLGSRVRTLALRNTFAVYTNGGTNLGAYAVASGFFHLPLQPGSVNWANNEIVGLQGKTYLGGEDAVLESKGYYFAEYFPSKRVTLSRHGQSGAGFWFDQVRGQDWLDNDLQSRLFDWAKNARKIGYTDAYFAEGEGIIRAGLAEAVVAEFVIEGSASVTWRRRAEIDSSERNSRTYNYYRYRAELVGAVNSFQVEGVLIV